MVKLVKNGDSFVLVNKELFCSDEKGFLGGGYGGIIVDGLVTDEASEAELDAMWGVIQSFDLVKEVDGKQCFYVPTNMELTIDGIEYANDIGMAKVNDRIQVPIGVSMLVMYEEQDEYEYQIRFTNKQ